ncbi:MAG TPA: vanadium-dependent haloperoxidase, partial [Gemmatimonadaceae bacterium]|nr:vanadium-dependent haloperoxidase [Gemmatimonadaceae bacterium]
EVLGRQVGGRIVASAQTDRFDAVFTGHIPVGPGFWSSSLVPPPPPLLPLLGEMRPFFLETGSQFRPGPPPEFGSPEFLVALGEVRQISDTRTDEQLRIGRFWALATGTLVAGYWNEQAEALIDRDGLSERDAAHAFALVNMAAMDANIACHDAKYVYWFIRPTKADPGITLIPQDGDLVAVGLPNHPSYPSNHACVSGAASVVLGGIFPSDSHRLFALGREAGISRLYAGLHYRFDMEAGFDIAANVVALARERDPAAGQPFPMR